MKALLLVVTLLFLGCDNKINTQADLNNNGVTEIGENVYIKGIRIKYANYQYHTVYVYCTKDGTVIPNTPTTTTYKINKDQQVTNSTMP